MPVPLPPKFGQEKEVPGYWKERLVVPREKEEDISWTGVDMEDEDEEPVRPLLNVLEKRENWKEGNYVSYGTGSASALEKIQGMHVPLHSYDAHRKAREDLWSAERVAQNLAKHQAKLLNQQMKMEERARGAQGLSEGTLPSSTNTGSTGRVAPLARAAPTAAATTAAGPSELESMTQGASQSATHAGPSGLSASTSRTGTTMPTTSTATTSSTTATSTTTSTEKPTESTEDVSKRPSQAPARPKLDNRFAPEKIPYVPWYRRLTNYRPAPTGLTADEEHAHRSYIVPHPIEAVKNNLLRSWSAVFVPTWRLVKALKVSFTSGAQTQIWRDAWSFTAEGEQTKLLTRANQLFKEHIARERKRLEQEKASRPDENNNDGNS
ncbi:hypothetical protein FRC17_004616 [Serendipita sp. 399]|nr:hypothetical protein FRC17_004616 [Serendipita sp. 399]